MRVRWLNAGLRRATMIQLKTIPSAEGIWRRPIPVTHGEPP